MQIINQQPNPIITIIGCQHGNERIGIHCFNKFILEKNKFQSVQYILANEPAIKTNTRFVAQDLNRSFPGDLNGENEKKLANEILPHLRSSRFVLDLHTTTSKIKMTPIVTNLDADTRQIVNLCDSQEVALIEPPLSTSSLIGQCRAGVSLEYNEQFADTDEALADVFRITQNLLEGVANEPRPRDIFHVAGAVPESVKLPSQTENFVFSDLLGGYPFLVGERAYPNGLVAKIKEKMVI